MIFIIVMIIEDLIKKILKEATGDSTGSRGSYVPPLQPGMRDFDKSELAPFTDSVSEYKSPLVSYDSYDHDWDLRSDQIRALEKTARKISNFIKKHPDATNSDEDGNVLNRTPSGKEKKIGKKKEIVPIKEADTSKSAGEYTGPVELGLKKWKNNILAPFTEFIDTEFNHQKKQKTVKNNVKKTVGIWEKNSDGTYKQDEYDTHTINEDLAVWFGKKKKPKGSSQPKGPWVDICRKVDGKHPPCGRSDASKGSYPKCRAAGVAGKMSDSEKRNACSQKRKAEKNDPQSGKGQKPVMVSHKKKTNESMKRKIITLTENDLTRIVRRVLNEQTKPNPGAKLNLLCQNDIIGDNFREYGLLYGGDSDYRGGIDGGGVKRVELKYAPNPTRQTYESDSKTFTLDVTPEKSLSSNFLERTELDDEKSIGQGKNGEKMFLIGLRKSHLYFCSMDYGTDPSWETYFNSL